MALAEQKEGWGCTVVIKTKIKDTRDANVRQRAGRGQVSGFLAVSATFSCEAQFMTVEKQWKTKRKCYKLCKAQ